MKRGSGVLMPISALPGAYSIGGFSDYAKKFIDVLFDCGFRYWQVLPFSPVDDFFSPYQSCSAFGGNPYLIDLCRLEQKGLLTKNEVEACRQESPYACEYERLQRERIEILKLASSRVQNRTEIETFIHRSPQLEAFCRFMAIRQAEKGACWSQWHREQPSPDVLFLWQFIQYEFFTQWQSIKEYANQKEVYIIGDLPFYVSYDSADVWNNQKLFMLDDKHRPSCVAGVPPDYFAKDGQLWGNPLYDWEQMEATDFSWWRERVGHSLTLFDGIRLDHFRAIDSFWAVDAGAKTAKEGRWMQGPGKKLVDAILEESKGKLIIAEDLGEITDSVRSLVADSGFPGMRVLQFGFGGEADTPHMPHHYPNNSVAYTGTHDNNTLLGFIWEMEADRRRELFAYCGYDGTDWSHACDSIIRTIMMSHAGLVIFPIQDLLCYGSDTRLNVPGRAEGNWRFRLTQKQIDEIDRDKFRTLNRLYRR